MLFLHLTFFILSQNSTSIPTVLLPQLNKVIAKKDPAFFVISVTRFNKMNFTGLYPNYLFVLVFHKKLVHLHIQPTLQDNSL